MVRIPLRYSDVVVGLALVDDNREELRDLGYYSVTLPRHIRKIAGKRADVMLAMLESDPTLLPKCRPFLSVRGTQVMLVHLVLRPAMVDFTHSLMSKQGLVQIRDSIGRVVHVDGDHTNCQMENLRELTKAEFPL